MHGEVVKKMAKRKKNYIFNILLLFVIKESREKGADRRITATRTGKNVSPEGWLIVHFGLALQIKYQMCPEN